MLTTNKDIREEILDNWEYLEELNENGVDDYLDELADSRTPIYYGDIIEEWRELPMEYSDTWHDYPMERNATITGLMTLDLANYYRNLYSQLYSDIKTEKQEESED
jgi:hypothetical protein